MWSMRYLVQRNLAIFLNNPMNIFLSLASILVVLSLYLFFLRDFLQEMVGGFGLYGSFAEEFTDRMVFAGLLIVMNTTTCFSMIQLCVSDRAAGIRRDFLSAPITGFALLGGYWIAAVMISFLLTMVTVFGGELFFHWRYGNHLPLSGLLRICGISLFSSCINGGILLCLARNLRDAATFSTFANLYGTVIGFLSGAYLPFSFYPAWLKPFLNFFPPLQLTSLMKRFYIAEMEEGIRTKEGLAILHKINQSFGVDLNIKNHVLCQPRQWSFLIMVLVVLLLYLWVSSHKSDI